MSVYDATGERLHEYIKGTRTAQPYTDPLKTWEWNLIEVVLAQLEICSLDNPTLFNKHLDDDKCDKFMKQASFGPWNVYIHRKPNWVILSPVLSCVVVYKQRCLFQLLGFYSPKNRHFSKLTDDWRCYSLIGCRLMRVAVQSRRETPVHGYLRAFIEDLMTNLAPVSFGNRLSNFKIIVFVSLSFYEFAGALCQRTYYRTVYTWES